MRDDNPTTKQIVIFTILMSFLVAIIGTVLTLGVFGPLFGFGEATGGPLQINKPGILERIKETVVQSEVSERVLRQDELIVQVVEKASPAVVSVVASKDVPVIERFFINPFEGDPFFKEFFEGNGFGFEIPQFKQNGTERKEISSGTGFFVSSDGFVVTNKHVVSDLEADYTVFMNDGRKTTATVLARDPIHDLAVLKVEGSNFAYLGLSNAQVKIGQTAIAIGNALGEFRNTVSVGIVSGLNRSVIASGASTGPESLQELIQTDAAINPGNSGGPLLNLDGEVIGINTAVARGAENIGFAIPVSKIIKNLQDVRKHGRIIYPFLGVSYVVVTKDLAEKEKLGKDFGIWLVAGDEQPAVVLESPADKAGLRDGDIIFEVNSEPLTQDKAFASIIQNFRVGDEITLKVIRKNGDSSREFEARAILEERK